MDRDRIPHTPTSRAGETHLTRASMFVRLKADRPIDREAAWVEFRSKYAPMIAGFARRCGATRQDVDDIIQDVMAAFVAADEFAYDPAKGRFRGWLKTCTVRAAIRRAGKNVRFQGVPLDRVPHVELAVEPLWNDVWEKQLVAHALAGLRLRHRDSATFVAFEKYVLLEQPAAAVAAELGVSVESVYQAKTRITRELREALADAGD